MTSFLPPFSYHDPLRGTAGYGAVLKNKVEAGIWWDAWPSKNAFTLLVLLSVNQTYNVACANGEIETR